MNAADRVRKKIRKTVRRTRDRIDHRPVAHFFHIGKTGGSALRLALLDVESEGTYRTIRHGHKAILQDVPVGEKFFFSVRDPIDRYVSGFLSRQREGRPRSYRRWTQDEAAAFSRFETPDALGLALGADDEVARAEAEQAMRSIQHVRSSYWRWFKDPDYFESRSSDLLWIGRLEHLDLGSLAAALGVDQLSMPEDPTVANRATAPKPRLSELSRQNLRQWYAKDYEFLELCHELFPPSSHTADP